MKLLNCHIVSFGCLSDLKIEFHDGINLLYAENGAGKSTLAVFLKAMLYGLPASTRRDLTENERKRYTPWGGGRFGGSLEFTHGGAAYRVERFFETKERDDTAIVYDLATNQPTERFEGNLGEALFGVDADGFERSLYISQRAPFAHADNNTIRARLGELVEVSDDLGDFHAADELLDEARRRYRSTGDRGRIAELAREIDEARENVRQAEARVEAVHEAERALAALAVDIQANEQAITEIRKEKEASAQRRLLSEQHSQYLRLNEALNSSRRALLPYEEFFGDMPPTDEALEVAEADVREAEAARLRAEAAAMSREDAHRLAALREGYGSVPPTDEACDRLAEVYRQKKEAREAARLANSEKSAALEALIQRFPGGPPTEEDEDALAKAAEQAFSAEDARNAAVPTRRQLALTAALGILGLLTVTVGLVLLRLPLLPVILLSVGACPTLAAVGLAVHFKMRTRALEGTLRAARSHLSALLCSFGYGDKSLRAAYELLTAEVKEYRRLLAQEQERARREAEATERENAAEEIARAMLCALIPSDMLRKAMVAESIALAKAEGTDEAFLLCRSLRNDGNDYRRLAKLEEECATAVNEEIRIAEEHEQSAALFFAPYKLPTDITPRRAVTVIRDNLLLGRKCAQSLKEAHAARERFLAETGYDPETPLPPMTEEPALLDHKEKELLREQLEMNAKQATLKAEHAALEDAESVLEQKRAVLALLLEKKEAAERALSLILSAKRILTEAKEDLSTRYLRHMEKSFDGYMDALAEAPSTYHFDTELHLSTDRMGARRPVEALSRGQRDLAAFCARLSLVDAVFSKETPFLLLDDPFVNLDDAAYLRAVELLERLSSQVQIIYAICTQARVPNGRYIAFTAAPPCHQNQNGG